MWFYQRRGDLTQALLSSVGPSVRALNGLCVCIGITKLGPPGPFLLAHGELQRHDDFVSAPVTAVMIGL